jgi:hypothetical protein
MEIDEDSGSRLYQTQQVIHNLYNTTMGKIPREKDNFKNTIQLLNNFYNYQKKHPSSPKHQLKLSNSRANFDFRPF